MARRRRRPKKQGAKVRRGESPPALARDVRGSPGKDGPCVPHDAAREQLIGATSPVRRLGQNRARESLHFDEGIYIRVAEDIRPEEERQFATVAPFPALPEEPFGTDGFNAARAAERAWKSRRTRVAFSSHKTGELNGYKSFSCVPSGIRIRGFPGTIENFRERTGTRCRRRRRKFPYERQPNCKL